MKRILVKIELTEDKENLKPKSVSNLIVIPDKNGGYSFYYEENDNLTQLFVKGVKIIEVAELDDIQQLLLEGKLSPAERKVLRQRN